MLIYHGTGAVTAAHPYRVRLHLDAELAIPFVPASILIYQSLTLAFLFAPFILRSRRELEALALSLAAVTLVAGIGFLLAPAEPAYGLAARGAWASLYEANERIALRTNLLPSLHVAMTRLDPALYAMRCGVLGKALLSCWAAAIGAATLLTHQHHVIDAITGLLLAWWGWHWVYVPWQSRRVREANTSCQPAQRSRAAGLMSPSFRPSSRQCLSITARRIRLRDLGLSIPSAPAVPAPQLDDSRGSLPGKLAARRTGPPTRAITRRCFPLADRGDSEAVRHGWGPAS